jgi:ribosomal protein S27AE
VKNSLTCPKCNGQKIILVPGSRIEGSGGTAITTGFISMAKIDRYICESCGYNEEWMSSPEDIEKVKKRFGRA